MTRKTTMMLTGLAAASLFALPALAGQNKMDGKMHGGKMHDGMMRDGKMMQTPASKKAQAHVNKIKAGSHYNCCIKGKCDWCAVHMGTCPCGSHAAGDKPVCINCKGGWEAGMGVIPGKTAADIKVMTMADMKKMMGGKDSMKMHRTRKASH